MKIVVSKNGPYLVFGDLPVDIQIITPNQEGMSWEWTQGKSFKPVAAGEAEGESYYRLCRCGRSKNKPFCDDTHLKIKFEGKETATRKPYDRQAEVTKGPTLLLSDAENLCAFARFCDPGGQVWNLVGEEGEDARNLTIREGNHCPSGRLVVRDRKTGKVIEDALPHSIGVIEDPALGVSGPLWLRGGIPLESEDGKPYEVRNRVTLCRCGASSNMPFCNGSHASIKFKDELFEFPQKSK
jgi:CDGSH-type Zn-finger protein